MMRTETRSAQPQGRGRRPSPSNEQGATDAEQRFQQAKVRSTHKHLFDFVGPRMGPRAFGSTYYRLVA